jgi:ABC-type multidrug transport system ATPase subunit
VNADSVDRADGTPQHGPLAEARQLSVCFGSLVAVDRASMAVHAGEVVGLLGANGAGKTTLLRTLLGLLAPSGGDALLFGAAPTRQARRRLGYVPQTLGLYDDMTVAENWAFATDAFDVGHRARTRRGTRPELPESIFGFRHELVRDLSLGSQRRVAFAVAFSHAPELLVLDEPTSGVAPLGAARLWEDVRSCAESATGVLVTTHNLEEAEQCDRLVVMIGGQVAAAGTVDEVIGGRTVVELRCDDWRQAFALLDAAGLVVQVHGDVLRVPASDDDVERVLARRGLDVRTARVPATLEEAFVSMVTKPATVSA